MRDEPYSSASLPAELAQGLTARASTLETSREALLVDIVARYLA